MKINDRVICIADTDSWFEGKSNQFHEGPKFKQQLIVNEINQNGNLRFKKFPNRFFSKEFFIKIQTKNESIYIKIESKKNN